MATAFADRPVSTDEADAAAAPPGKFMRPSWARPLVRRGGRGIKEARKKWTHHHRGAQTEPGRLDSVPVSPYVPRTLDTQVVGHIARVLRAVPIHPSVFPATRLEINLWVPRCVPEQGPSLDAPELRIDPPRLPINVWRLLLDFGAREHSFSHFIVPHFPDSGGVFTCLARNPQLSRTSGTA